MHTLKQMQYAHIRTCLDRQTKRERDRERQTDRQRQRKTEMNRERERVADTKEKGRT